VACLHESNGVTIDGRRRTGNRTGDATSPIAGCAGTCLFQLWPKFTGAIVDPVVRAGIVAILRIGYRRSSANPEIEVEGYPTLILAPALDDVWNPADLAINKVRAFHIPAQIRIGLGHAFENGVEL